MSRVLFLILTAFGLAAFATQAAAHCMAGVAPHAHCRNPPPKISSPRINPTWQPKGTDFASKAEFDEALASYRAEISAARSKGILSSSRASSLMQQSRALKNSVKLNASRSGM